VGAFHAHSLGQLSDFPVAQEELLLQVSALELLARLSQWQRKEILLHQGLIEAGLDRKLALDLLEADFLTGAEHEG
jgi:hypothetical protein